MAKKEAVNKEKVDFKERFKAYRNIPRFLKMVWRISPKLALGNAFLRVLKAAVPITQLYIGKLIIDDIVLLINNEITDPSMLWLYIGLEFGIAILSDFLSRGINLTDSLLGDLVANDSSVKLMKHAALLDLYHFEDADFYDKLERARRQTVGRTVLMSQILGQVQDLITLGFLAAGLVATNPWLILILIVSLIPAFIGENYFNEKNYSLVRGWTPERRELDYLRYTGASDQTAKEIKIFGLASFLTDRFKGLAENYYLANKKLATRRASWGSFLSALGTAGYYVAYIFIIIQTINGLITLGTLTFLAGSFLRMRNLLESMMMRFNTMAEGALYLQDFFDFFDIKPQIARVEKVKTFPKPIKEGFTFENLGFRYAGTDFWAVRYLNFTLHKGEKMALVGENGAGKTTLVKLLARLYDPTEGRILLDGVDLREYDPEDIRQQIGVIFQDFVKYQFKFGENIGVGNISERENKQRIESSASMSMADSVVKQLPDGYDQMIGRRFANGVELSGGQWQKIALGRVYMRDAQLLILDEPTAALDARAEHDVFQRFADLSKDKTAVLISHRFSTVRMADRILVLQNGEMEELGTHEELLDKRGKYAELFNLQAKGYV